MRKQLITGSILVVVLLVALLTRLGAVVIPLKDFDSDEAVVGLMAREILAGESWPVYYAGQSYLGALEPWSVAASFTILGESAFSLRLVPLLYSLAFLVAALFLLRRFFLPLETGLILLWTALGTPFFNLWTVKARGGFAEVLLLGTLFLLLFESGWRQRDHGAPRLLVLGAMAGFALFVNPLSGALMVVPLSLLLARTMVECGPVQSAEGWTPADLILFRPLRATPGLARAISSALAALGLLAWALAVLLILVGDVTLEGLAGRSFPEGTEVARYVLVYFALLYAAQVVLLSRSRPGGLGRILRDLWRTSGGLRMFLAIAAGHLAFSLVAASAAALLGEGGHAQPFRLAPIVSWPERIHLLFGQIVPTATWPLAGPVMAALCILLAVLLWRRRGELDLGGGDLPKPVPPLFLFGGTTLATLLLVVISAYAQDASAARYLLPLLLSLPASLYLLFDWGVAGGMSMIRPAGAPAGTGAAGARGQRIFASVTLVLLTVGLAAGSLWGQASLLSARSSGSPYPGLVQELETRGGEDFVADYWTAYPLAFLAGDRFAVAPADGADRFPLVSASVRASGPDAYVFVEGSVSLAEFRASSQVNDAREEVVRPAAGGPRYHLFYIGR